MARRDRKGGRAQPRQRRGSTTAPTLDLGMSLKGACWFTAVAVVFVCLAGLYTLVEYRRNGQITVHVGTTAVACTLVAATAMIWLQRWRSRARKTRTKKEL